MVLYVALPIELYPLSKIVGLEPTTHGLQGKSDCCNHPKTGASVWSRTKFFRASTERFDHQSYRRKIRCQTGLEPVYPFWITYSPVRVRIWCFTVKLLTNLAVYRGIEPLSPDRQSGIIAVILIHHNLVGLVGLEPTTFRLKAESSTQLSYNPKLVFVSGFEPEIRHPKCRVLPDYTTRSWRER